MLQTIYESESNFSTTTDRLVGHQRLLDQHKMHNVNSVDIKPEVPLDPVSPLDLRTDLRMLGPGSDPGVWERQLQQELLLIQKQQHVQKQLLISEFQKQHENLTRQHQAQLQEHLKAAIGLKEKTGEVRHGLPGQLLGPVPMPTVTSMETKVSPSHQALLQHLLQKEQMRRQKILSSSGQGSMPAHPPLPPGHEGQALRQQQAQAAQAPAPEPDPQQKQYQQQIHINKLLSKSIEQLRQPSSLVNPHLQESEEEEEDNTRRMEDERMDMQEDRMPPGGVIQKHTLSSSSSSGSNGSLGELSSIVEAHHRLGVIKVKEEPIDSEDESLSLSNQSLAAEQSSSLHQVKGQLVIRAMI
ncbi:hypothetical protein J4Q44_G00026920 [Coregonus suidteri]|uniref:histone deacetylase n=1 Tax=Coregonus suidteri TaxID=861788 RepID=A0AAN8MK56_9TELE